MVKQKLHSIVSFDEEDLSGSQITELDGLNLALKQELFPQLVDTTTSTSL